jgi:hypothetical protein
MSGFLDSVNKRNKTSGDDRNEVEGLLKSGKNSRSTPDIGTKRELLTSEAEIVR